MRRQCHKKLTILVMVQVLAYIVPEVCKHFDLDLHEKMQELLASYWNHRIPRFQKYSRHKTLKKIELSRTTNITGE